ncbi:hypothetical protein BU14_0225s0016 [Porphyra umbilicalis]|uniref:Uncharacterized protein n=1 Tax=Porphyra umbilicalis TaxID=2786 RepID=A0A1X6P484_PORUM|nr:hypothetical protein BU14_0225s0016 [Porphyra umbilicalis]|eukprot:OSX75699.1 hypothetical protein BU14_0225s0016 [Porphyra umbilicalis]
MPRSHPPIPGALRALAPLDPDQRRWLLSTDGSVEAGLTPAGLSAAATWAHTEAVSKELLQAVLPGATAVAPPTAVPGAALTVDLGHLFVPYASANGVTTGLIAMTVRYWVYQHTPGGPVVAATGGPHTVSSSGRYASPLPAVPKPIEFGRFLLNENTGELYTRVRLAGELSIKCYSPSGGDGRRGGRTRTFSLFTTAPEGGAAASDIPGVAVSHMILDDTPLVGRTPTGALSVSGGGLAVGHLTRSAPSTSVIDFDGFAAVLSSMSGLYGVRIRGALSGVDLGAASGDGGGADRLGPFPIHTVDTVLPLGDAWHAVRPAVGTVFGGDELAASVAVRRGGGGGGGPAADPAADEAEERRRRHRQRRQRKSVAVRKRRPEAVARWPHAFEETSRRFRERPQHEEGATADGGGGGVPAAVAGAAAAVSADAPSRAGGRGGAAAGAAAATAVAWEGATGEPGAPRRGARAASHSRSDGADQRLSAGQVRAFAGLFDDVGVEPPSPGKASAPAT